MEDSHQHQPARFCNYTYLSEKELASSKDDPSFRLLRCSRCKDTYYRDQEAQKAHWKVHKKVCAPAAALAQSKEAMSTVSQQAVAGALCGIFEKNSTISINYVVALVHFLKRLETLCMQEDEEKGVVLSSHLMERPEFRSRGSGDQSGRLFNIVGNLMDAPNESLEVLWATPGITNYILGHDLISKAMKEKQANGQLPSFAETNGSKLYNRDFHLHPIFCNFMGVFVSAAAVYIDEAGDGGDGEADPSHFRGTPLAAAAARRAMSWWSNPYSRASIPWRIDCNATPRRLDFAMVYFSLLQADVTSMSEYMNDESEVVPGLTLKQALLIVSEEADFAKTIPSTKFSQLLGLFARTTTERSTAWKAFTIKDRALVARSLTYRYLAPSNEAVDGNYRLLAPSHVKCADNLMHMVTGWRIDTCLWLKVIKEALPTADSPPADDPAGAHLQRWLNYVHDAFKPKVLLLWELVKERHPSTPDIPEDAIRSICEFAFPTEWGEISEEYEL